MTINNHNRLILSSFLMLFVELMIIRWAGANIYALSYFSNFILIASFLGISIGFIRKPGAIGIFKFAPIYLALFVLGTYYYSYEYVIRINPLIDDLNFDSVYFKENLLPVELTLPLIFIATTIVMSTLADGVARAFRQFTPLEAYRLEILGSLLGVITFSMLSFLNASPLWWGMIICMSFTALLIQSWRLERVMSLLQIAALILLVTVFHKEASIPGHHWSPYYKIFTQPYSHDRYAVIVNGWPQQFVESVEQRKHYKPFYFKPYEHLTKQATLNNVLIIGAGTGGDVAIALANGAKHVDAVEIDPRLAQLGREINPNQPYHDARVTVTIDDGRSFLQRSKQQYDLIIYALPDSLMVLSGLSSLRLESYLFTSEGIKQAQQHLTTNGVISMYNYYRERWLIDRLANTLKSTFGHTPCFDSEGLANHWLSVLTIGQSPITLQCPFLWSAEEPQYVTPATDDHPFLYLKESTLSSFYIISLLFTFFTAIYAFKLSGARLGAIKSNFDLFLMGTAFLLLETKSVTTFALLFGSTWFVNSLVFIGVLFAVYFSIIFTRRAGSLNSFILYGALLGSLLLAWLVPNQTLLLLPVYLRFIFASILTFTPIFIANLIFADRFRDTSHSSEAFGANLMGAVLGGLVEYSSLIIGYRSLIIVVAVLYLAAIMFCLPWPACGRGVGGERAG